MQSALLEQLIIARFLQALGGAVYVRTRPWSVICFQSERGPDPIADRVDRRRGTSRGAAAGQRCDGTVRLARHLYRVACVGIAWLLIIWFQLPEPLSVERRVRVQLSRVFAAYGRLLSDPATIGLLLAGELLMARHKQDTASAPALFGAAQFGFGACSSVMVNLLHNGSASSMAWVITAASVLSLPGQGVYRAHVSELHQAQ